MNSTKIRHFYKILHHAINEHKYTTTQITNMYICKTKDMGDIGINYLKNVHSEKV